MRHNLGRLLAPIPRDRDCATGSPPEPVAPFKDQRENGMRVAGARHRRGTGLGKFAEERVEGCERRIRLNHVTGTATAMALPVAPDRYEKRKTVGSHFATIREHIMRKDRDLGPVLRFQLLHDVADMHLHGALAHVQFVGDALVGLALPKNGKDGRLTRREETLRLAILGRIGVFCTLPRHHRACRRERAARFHETHGFDRDIKRDACRNIAARAAFQCRDDMIHVLRLGNNDDRDIDSSVRQDRQFAPDLSLDRFSVLHAQNDHRRRRMFGRSCQPIPDAGKGQDDTFRVSHFQAPYHAIPDQNPLIDDNNCFGLRILEGRISCMFDSRQLVEAQSFLPRDKAGRRSPRRAVHTRRHVVASQALSVRSDRRIFVSRAVLCFHLAIELRREQITTELVLALYSVASSSEPQLPCPTNSSMQEKSTQDD